MSLKIRKRSKNCYELRYTINGSQKSIYGKTRLSCREQLKAVKTQNRKPRLIKTMCFEEWFAKWIDIYKKNQIKANTLHNILLSINKDVMPYIAKKSIRQIKSEDIQKIVNLMSDTPRQATIVFTQLNACFNQAFKLNLIAYNPCSAVVIKKTNGNKGKALTREEEQKLIQYLEDTKNPIRILIYLYLVTGMRRSELLNINYSDLDFNKNEIHIHGTKTKTSDRIIQVSSNVLKLFPNKTKPFEEFTPCYVNKEFKKICCKLGFKDIKLHSLRHTFATRCIENGVEMVVVQSWLGHSSISLTIDTYTHIEDNFKREELKKISYDFIP